jgi:hypothetical protein
MVPRCYLIIRWGSVGGIQELNDMCDSFQFIWTNSHKVFRSFFEKRTLNSEIICSGGAMAKRLSTRLECTEKCQLHVDGAYHPVVLKNISKSGMLLYFSGQLPKVRAGDKCGLYLCNDRNVCPCEFACEIIRVETAAIAVKFTGEV